MSTFSDETFDQIKAFVIEQRWEYDFVLTRETELRKDLKIWGDDATDFILAFGKTFNVDLSKMYLDKYFPPEGSAILQKYEPKE
jgi:acyl carrier protein